jgi:hypothetical protein
MKGSFKRKEKKRQQEGRKEQLKAGLGLMEGAVTLSGAEL